MKSDGSISDHGVINEAEPTLMSRRRTGYTPSIFPIVAPPDYTNQQRNQQKYYQLFILQQNYNMNIIWRAQITQVQEIQRLWLVEHLRHQADAERRGSACTQTKSPDPAEATATQIKTFKAEDWKARSHIFLNLGEDPATLIISLLFSDATTKEVWKKLTDSYQKENIQSKLNLHTRLHNVT